MATTTSSVYLNHNKDKMLLDLFCPDKESSMFHPPAILIWTNIPNVLKLADSLVV